MPFRRIVAVELAPELHAIAERNLARFRHPARACWDVECVCGDAQAFEFPDTPLVVYMWNPFWDDVMQTVAQNLAASYRQSPRPIYLGLPEPHLRGDALERGLSAPAPQRPVGGAGARARGLPGAFVPGAGG